jgi:hypothetical protein
MQRSSCWPRAILLTGLGGLLGRAQGLPRPHHETLACAACTLLIAALRSRPGAWEERNE